MADLAERVDDLICSFDSSADTTMDTLSMLIFGWMLFGLVVLCVGKFIYNRFVLLQEVNKTSHPTTTTTAGSGHKESQSHSAAAGLHVIGESVVLLGAGAAASGVASKQFGFDKFRSSGKSGGAGAPIGVSGSSASSVGYIPPTPPTRKRLTRKTSGPLVSPARSSRALHLPSSTGPDPDAVRWTNEMLMWLHSDFIVLDELLAVWVTSLNDFVAGSVQEVIYRFVIVSSFILD